MKYRETEFTLKNNIDLISELKDRLVRLEDNNKALGSENEELRQFSLDGYDIAKNVQQLTAEREILSVVLADKTSTIRNLLEENEKLGDRLRKAQEEAVAYLKVAEVNAEEEENPHRGILAIANQLADL